MTDRQNGRATGGGRTRPFWASVGGSAAVAYSTGNGATAADIATATNTGEVDTAAAGETAPAVVLNNASSSRVLLHVVLPDLVRVSTG